MSFELTKPPSLLAPERFLTGSGPSWSPASSRRPQPLPESPETLTEDSGPTQTDTGPEILSHWWSLSLEPQPLPAGQQEAQRMLSGRVVDRSLGPTDGSGAQVSLFKQILQIILKLSNI